MKSEPHVSICTCPENRRAMCCFTFDDGTLDHLTFAAPELEKRHWAGTFFINPRSNDRLRCRQLTRTQIAELARRGHDIGLHSMTHRLMSRLQDKNDFSGLAWEIAENIRELENITGRRPVSYTAPYGGNPPFIEEILRAKNILNTPPRIGGVPRTEQDKAAYTAPGAFTVFAFHGVAPGYGSYAAPENLEEFPCALDFIQALEEEIYIGTFAELATYRRRVEHTSLVELAPHTLYLKPDGAADAFYGPLYLTLGVNGFDCDLRVNGLPLQTEINGVFRAYPGDVLTF